MYANHPATADHLSRKSKSILDYRLALDKQRSPNIALSHSKLKDVESRRKYAMSPSAKDNFFANRSNERLFSNQGSRKIIAPLINRPNLNRNKSILSPGRKIYSTRKLRTPLSLERQVRVHNEIKINIAKSHQPETKENIKCFY